jgi:hypothetical protein
MFTNFRRAVAHLRAMSFREQAPGDFIWREMSMRALERVIPRNPRRCRPLDGYFALVELRLSRCRRADELRGGRNAGRSIISLRRFGAAYVLREE